MTMKQTDENSEFLNNQNPYGQVGKTYSEEEYKNLQAFGTKANQGLINTSKKLAEKDPKELLSMDSTIQNKVIKDIWGYDNLDELKVMLPDIFDEDEYRSNKSQGQGELEQLRKEQELLKYKLNKKDIDDEIEKYSSINKDISNSIPNFNEKVKEELKFISSELPVKERVDRAIKLISGNDINIEAYLQLQGKNNIMSSKTQVNDDYIKDAQNKLRVQLGLKVK